MTFEILTKNGTYEYLPIKLNRGRKLLDLNTSRSNLLDFREIANADHLPFGIIYGTLLGAVRENNFIEYDEDTDVYVLDENREQLLALLFKLREKGFEVVRYNKDLLSIMRNDDYIDIYIFRKTFQKRVCNEYNLNSKYFDTFSKIKFLEEDFCTLNDYHSFLEKAYGKDWRIPKRNSPAEVKIYNIGLKKFIKKLLPESVLSFYKKNIRLN